MFVCIKACPFSFSGVSQISLFFTSSATFSFCPVWGITSVATLTDHHTDSFYPAHSILLRPPKLSMYKKNRPQISTVYVLSITSLLPAPIVTHISVTEHVILQVVSSHVSHCELSDTRILFLAFPGHNSTCTEPLLHEVEFNDNLKKSSKSNSSTISQTEEMTEVRCLC